MASVYQAPDFTIFRQDISNEIIKRFVQLPGVELFRTATPRHGENDARFQIPEYVQEAATGILNANYVAASGTIDVVDGTLFEVNDYINIDNHRDTNFQDLTFRVDVIAVNTLTVTLIGPGADTSFTNPVGGARIRINRGYPDATTAGVGDYDEPTLGYGFFQLWKESLKLGQKAINMASSGGVYGVSDLISTTAQQKANLLAWRMYDALWFGVGRPDTASIGALTRSISEMVNVTGNLNRIDALGGAISETLVNDVIESIVKNGGNQGNKILFTNIANARKISQLRHDKVVYTTEAQINTFGGRVEAYQTDVSGVNQLLIIGHPRMTNNLSYILDPASISVVPRAGRPFPEIVDATQPGFDGYQWEMRVEAGYYVGHATRDHGVLYNTAD